MRTALAVTFVRSTNESIRELNAPPRFTDAHSDLLIMADYFDRAMDLMVSGIDDLDAEMLEESTSNLLAGNEAIVLTHALA